MTRDRLFFALASFLVACSGSTTGVGSSGSSGSSGTSGVAGSQEPTGTDPGSSGGGSGATSGKGGASGSSGLPAGAKRVFVTSASYSGDFRAELASSTAKAGAAAADALCQAAADAAELGGTWKAYVQDQSTLPNDRITAAGPWYLVDGNKAFNNKANLVTKPLVPIEVDEQGKRTIGSVWVGTGGATCLDWTSASYNDSAETASTYDTDNWRGSSQGYCNERNRLYCFEN